MAINLAALVAEWDVTQRFVDVIGGNPPALIVDNNPRRIAFGVAVPLGSDMYLQFATTVLPQIGIHFGSNEFRWFWWQEHGVMVNQAWWMIKFAGPDVSVTVYEVTQDPGAVH